MSGVHQTAHLRPNTSDPAPNGPDDTPGERRDTVTGSTPNGTTGRNDSIFSKLRFWKKKKSAETTGDAAATETATESVNHSTSQPSRLKKKQSRPSLRQSSAPVADAAGLFESQGGIGGMQRGTTDDAVEAISPGTGVAQGNADDASSSIDGRAATNEDNPAQANGTVIHPKPEQPKGLEHDAIAHTAKGSPCAKNGAAIHPKPGNFDGLDVDAITPVADSTPQIQHVAENGSVIRPKSEQPNGLNGHAIAPVASRGQNGTPNGPVIDPRSGQPNGLDFASTSSATAQTQHASMHGSQQAEAGPSKRGETSQRLDGNAQVNGQTKAGPSNAPGATNRLDGNAQVHGQVQAGASNAAGTTQRQDGNAQVNGHVKSGLSTAAESLERPHWSKRLNTKFSRASIADAFKRFSVSKNASSADAENAVTPTSTGGEANRASTRQQIPKLDVSFSFAS
jgi:hypothetical protein